MDLISICDSKSFFSEKYSLYEIQVSASTIAGEGSKTVAREFRTDEDSKFPFT